MTNLTKLFNYNGANISFRNDEGVAYVNATQMAKPFGKKPAKYLELPTTKELIKACIRKSDTSNIKFITSKMGSSSYGGGTWLHEDIAIDFAQWLSVDFKLWCNDRLKELMTTGTTSLSQLLPNMKELAQMVIDAENAKEKAELKIAELMPRSDYVDKVFRSDNTFNINEIAQDFGMSAKAMNKKLHEIGVHYKQGKNWMLYVQYRNRGLTKQVTIMRNEKPITHTVWTEMGRAFIHKRLNPEIMMSIAIKDESIHRLNNGYKLIN